MKRTVMTAVGTALAISALAPAIAAGDPITDTLNGLGLGGVAGGGSGGSGADGGSAGGGSAGGGSGSERAGVPPAYQPPLHGTNPHGQGSVATVDLNPLPTNPYPAEPPASGEEVVVGDSRGEQTPNGYHGKVTLLYLFGTPVTLLGVGQIESNPGQSNTGPDTPLQPGLDALCVGTMVCVQLLPMSSTTTSTGSANSFALARISTPLPLNVNLGESNGDIQESGGCQTSTGGSSIANGNIGPQSFNVLSADSTSTACNNGQQAVTNNSTILDLGPLAIRGCPNNVANSQFVLFPAPLGGGIVCNADDTNAGQTSNPYGVREALSTILVIPPIPIVLPAGLTVKVVLSGPESHAVAPPATPTTPTTPGGGAAPGGGGGTQGQSQSGEGGPAAAEAAAGEGAGELAFTGQNLLILALVGAALVSMGLASRRRHLA